MELIELDSRQFYYMTA